MRALMPSACWLLLLLVLGCGVRLRDERVVSVPAGSAQNVVIDPAPREQKIHVVMQSTGGPVSIYAFLEKDKQEAEKAANLRKASDKLLASHEKKEEADFDFTVPANNTAILMLSSASAKTASVKLKLNN